MNPTALRHVLSALAASLVLGAAPALADWEAEVHMKNAPPPGQKTPAPGMQGKMYGRKGQLRMDMEMVGRPGGGGMSMIFDFEKRTGITLLHTQRIATQRSLDAMPTKLPGSCAGKVQDFEACFKEQGYKKVGTEKVNGHPTTVYEGSTPSADGKPQRQKVWRPTDLAEVPYVRVQTFNAQGKLMTELNLTDIKVAPQPDAFFGPPAGYRMMDAPPMKNPMGVFKPEDFRGKTPEQIQEMIRQRARQGAPPPDKK